MCYKAERSGDPPLNLLTDKLNKQETPHGRDEIRHAG
jgi:hypothetical protein